MQNVTLGERIQVLRKKMKMSQKEFAVFLEIPQPSLSAYENNRNSPTVEVLINIAKKCHISLDWLCGISTYQHQLSSLSDVGDFLYSLLETNEIGVDIEVHDKLFNDIETDEDRWYTRLTFFGNDKEHESNADICFLIDKVSKDHEDFTSFAIGNDMYELAKQQTRNQYAKRPLTKKEYPNLSRDEILQKRFEYLKKITEDNMND